MSTFHAAASGAHNRSQAVAAQLLSGLPGLDLITFVCFQIDFGVARTGFACVVVIALVSLLGSFNASVGLSILGVGSLSYFFAPPSFEFRVDAPNDVVRIAFFLTTSLVAADLTTRVKRTKKQLGESKAALGEAQRIAHVGWWERDFGMGHVTLSDEACRIFGVQRVDLPDWHGLWLELIHPDDRARAEAPGAALVPGGPRCGVEYRSVRPDGTQRVVRSQEDVAGDDSGRPLRQFGVMQNITELRDAEHELRASETRFRTWLTTHPMRSFFITRMRPGRESYRLAPNQVRRAASSSPCAIRDLELNRNTGTEFSNPSTRQRPAVSEWGCQSADRSSTPTSTVYGQTLTNLGAPYFGSRFRQDISSSTCLETLPATEGRCVPENSNP